MTTKTKTRKAAPKAAKPAKKVAKKKAVKKDLFLEACKYLGEKPHLPIVSHMMPEDQAPIVAMHQTWKIIEANNKKMNWEADWADPNQRKFNVWNWIKKDPNNPAGFVFDAASDDGTGTSSTVGSRLVVGTVEEAIRIAKEAVEYYAVWMLKSLKRKK